MHQHYSFSGHQLRTKVEILAGGLRIVLTFATLLMDYVSQSNICG